MSTSKLATPELGAVEVDAMDRGSFVLKSALAVGAVYGSTAVSPFVRRAFAGAATGDIEILNFALTLEYLEAEFYRRGLRLGLRGEVRELAQMFGNHELQHVQALTGTIRKLGGKPAKKPAFTFPMKDSASFLKLAQTLEDTGVAAYNGAAPQITSKAVLAAAGSIVQNEARHAAAIRLLTKSNPAPAAFDKALSSAAVLKAVKPLIKA